MTDEQGYQGWKNYETWAMALWIDNEEGSYYVAREIVSNDASYRSADALKEWMEESMPDLGASVWADLLNAAFGEVDWHEVASHYLGEDA